MVSHNVKPKKGLHEGWSHLKELFGLTTTCPRNDEEQAREEKSEQLKIIGHQPRLSLPTKRRTGCGPPGQVPRGGLWDGGGDAGVTKDVTSRPQGPRVKASPAQPFPWVQICRKTSHLIKKKVQIELKKKKNSWGKY